ncbi:MAG: hypothetical protein F6K35_29845 [Okeania sp. SIO2H7]|nr:hypothetical protein [Okeania sp. SIO2H7]
MSPYEINLSDFIHILKTKPNLLSPEDWLSLEELLQTVPDDLEKLSNAITIWYENRPAIDNAIMELPIEETGDKGPKDQPTNLKPQEFKKIVENETRQHKTSSSPPPKPKPKK